jgi:hypothetical protein
VLLKEALTAELLTVNSGEPSDQQIGYLRDLAKAAGARAPARVTTRDQADAWIKVMLARRAIRALKTLRVSKGDLVAAVDAPDTEVDEVSSIGTTGRVFFLGGAGAGSRPHRLRVVARATDSGPTVTKHRKRAQNRRLLRRRGVGPPPEQGLRPLMPYSVGRGPSSANAEELTDVVDQARDERPIQRYVAEHPGVLGSLVVSSYGKFVIPLPRLGSEYIPDFVIAVADSAGIHYTLVEIESPRAKLALKDGQFAEKAREAIQQIESWREWLKDNLGYAQKAREENGLGLPGIRPDARGLVLIGRRTEAPSFRNRVVRQRLAESNGIEVHSYDWLIAEISPSRPVNLGGALRMGGTSATDLIEDVELDEVDLDALLAAELDAALPVEP